VSFIVSALIMPRWLSPTSFDSVAGILVRENFGTDPRTMGLVIGAVGLGTAISTVWAGSRGKRFSRQGLLVMGGIWVGLGLCLMVGAAVTRSVLASPGAVFFACLAGAGVSLLSSRRAAPPIEPAEPRTAEPRPGKVVPAGR